MLELYMKVNGIHTLERGIFFLKSSCQKFEPFLMTLEGRKDAVRSTWGSKKSRRKEKKAFGGKSTFSIFPIIFSQSPSENTPGSSMMYVRTYDVFLFTK